MVFWIYRQAGLAMCDIFAFSAGHNYTAREYLPVFAEKARENISGWGIGFFRNGQAFVEKSSEQVFSGDEVHGSFQRLARVIDSRIIVSHISCPMSGGRHSAHNNPFTLSYLDHKWLFVSLSIDQEIGRYQTVNEPRLEADVHSARMFEFLRDQMLTHTTDYPYMSLYGIVRASIRQLISDYPGHATFFLANESVLFAYTNFRKFLLLKKSETIGDVLLITSVKEPLSPDEWFPVEPEEDYAGTLMVIAGPDVLHLGNI
jgi:hypothetical protein